MGAAVISIINMKGGVWKTTLTKEVGYHLAKVKNKKVLLIDIDPQINLTQSIFKRFGYAQSEQIARNIKLESASKADLQVSTASIKNVLNGSVSNENPASLESSILNIPDTNLSIIPGELGLEFINRNLNSSQLENGLFNFIQKNKLREKYDYILIDCPPTYSSYTIAALKPSDFYIIPVKPEAYSILGINMLQKVVKEIVSNNDVYYQNRDLINLGIILTAVRDEGKETIGIENLIEDIKNSETLNKNKISVFQNRFLYNPNFQKNMSYFIDDSRSEKNSKPNLENLTNELMARIKGSRNANN